MSKDNPEAPNRLSEPEALDLVRRLAATTDNIVIISHARMRMLKRGITRRQIELCVQKGTITEGPFLGIENFDRRLSLMKDQLDLGLSRGWIGPGDAAMFDSRYANLKSQIDLARSQGLTYALGNSLERQLNQFNIDLSQRMSTASAGIIQ